MTSLNIGIAGAGIGGLAAGALLAQDGHNVVVYDKFDAPRPVGSGLVIQPVGQSVLLAAGAGNAISQGAHITRMLGHEAAQGKMVLDVTYGASNPGHFGLAIHRSTLFAELMSAATKAGATLVPSHPVAGYHPGTGSRFVFENGVQSAKFDLLIDASGASSRLSQLKSNQLPFGAVWGTVRWPEQTQLPRTELRQKYSRANRMAGILPIGNLPDQTGQHTAIFWSLPVDQMDRWRAKGIDAWIEDSTSLWPEFEPFASQITDLSQLVPARYSHGTLRRPYLPGLAIIGDAAHRASPQLGQGANMALLDAFSLREALRIAPAREALGIYAKTRRWHVRAYQMTSALFTPMYQSNSRILPYLRDQILAPVSRIPPLPRVLSNLVCGTMLPPAGSLSAQFPPLKTIPPVRAG